MPNQNTEQNQQVEDVFLNVENPDDNSTPLEKQVSTVKTVENAEEKSPDISESSLGQEDLNVSESNEAQVHNVAGENKKEFNISKILFYLIFSLIILLGAFAIWALVF
jgi:hypothetical protein